MDDFKYRILKEFVRGGADAEICYSDTAHLGTDRLPIIVKALREKIESLGGTFLFGARFTAFKTRDSKICSVLYKKDGEEREIPTDTVLFGIGHSARDTFFYLNSIGVKMENKPFGIGVRIEHPREYINALIYKNHKDEGLETASYHLVTHLKNNRSVYSFCMCPGGTVVAATSHEGAVVTNGMSEYKRDADNSNSALLVSVTPADFGADPLSGFIYQENIEKKAFSVSGDYKAPAIRLDDFLSEQSGTDFASVKPSYARGVVKSSLNSVLPDFVISSLREGIREFDSWLPGFYLPDATLTGAETRSTSPVRILRKENFESVSLSGLYPIGEGAGYAGGIVSSAYDGIRAANEIIEKNQ